MWNRIILDTNSNLFPFILKFIFLFSLPLRTLILNFQNYRNYNSHSSTFSSPECQTLRFRAQLLMYTVGP